MKRGWKNWLPLLRINYPKSSLIHLALYSNNSRRLPSVHPHHSMLYPLTHEHRMVMSLWVTNDNINTDFRPLRVDMRNCALKRSKFCINLRTNIRTGWVCVLVSVCASVMFHRILVVQIISKLFTRNSCQETIQLVIWCNQFPECTIVTALKYFATHCLLTIIQTFDKN